MYHAVRPDGEELAIKIYKTSILVFKDRQRYMVGNFRFKAGYSRRNPRKMVKLWAEKEMRNLKRYDGCNQACCCLHSPLTVGVCEQVGGSWHSMPFSQVVETPRPRHVVHWQAGMVR